MADDGNSGVFANLVAGFGPVQKVFLFFGFIVFMMGVPSGFTFQNRTLMIGVALLLAGLAGHYWPERQFLDGSINWGNLVMALAYFAFFLVTCRFAYLGH